MFSSTVLTSFLAAGAATALPLGEMIGITQELNLPGPGLLPMQPDDKRSAIMTATQYAELQAAVDAVMEQAVGILPNEVATKLDDTVMQILEPVSPPALDALETQLSSAVLSVTASLSGNAVTEVEKLQSCLSALMTSSKPLTTLKSTAECAIGDLASDSSNLLIAVNGVLNQFVGYLPENAVVDVVDLLSPVLEKLPTKDVTNDVSAALESYTATLSGNAVTAIWLAEPCIVGLVETKGVRSALVCMQPTVDTAQVAVYGVLEQLFDVMTPSLVLDLQDVAFKVMGSSAEAVTAEALISEFDYHLIEMSEEVPAFLEKDGELQGCLATALEGKNADVTCHVSK